MEPELNLTSASSYKAFGVSPSATGPLASLSPPNKEQPQRRIENEINKIKDLIIQSCLVIFYKRALYLRAVLIETFV
jgi:hypothetical protein